jgi:hypothetical protein
LINKKWDALMGFFTKAYRDMITKDFNNAIAQNKQIMVIKAESTEYMELAIEIGINSGYQLIQQSTGSEMGMASALSFIPRQKAVTMLTFKKQ